jgi:hypothetical protein
MTVSLPYRRPRLTTCLTIRNVNTKADILVEPRRLRSTGTLNDIREGKGITAFRVLLAHWGRGVTIFGTHPDRIVQGRPTGRRPSGRKHRSGCPARPRQPGCLRLPEGAGGCLGRRHGCRPGIPLRNYPAEAAARPVETGVAFRPPPAIGAGHADMISAGRGRPMATGDGARPPRGHRHHASPPPPPASTSPPG